MLTAAEAATERGISASRMRDLIREHRIVAPSRQPGRDGGNLYPAEALRAIPGPGQGRRNDPRGPLPLPAADTPGFGELDVAPGDQPGDISGPELGFRGDEDPHVVVVLAHAVLGEPLPDVRGQVHIGEHGEAELYAGRVRGLARGRRPE